MESVKPSEKHNFVHGVPRLADLGYVSCADRQKLKDREEHTVLFDWDAGEFGEVATTSGLTAGLCVVSSPLEQLVAVGEYGNVVVFGSGDSHEELIGTVSDGPRAIGPLRGVRAIGGLGYAVGMKRQVYLRNGSRSWQRLGGITEPAPGEMVGFEAIDGFNHNELYAVGWKGEIWESEGVAWRSDTSLTNLILTDVCCASDGNVYICGQQGLLIRGRRGKWSLIDTKRFQFDYWGLTFFAGHLYVAGSRVLLRLDDDELVPVDTGPDPATSFGHLRHIEEVMWSTGADDLMAFDGSSWTRLG